jgi:hypothetical protein
VGLGKYVPAKAVVGPLVVVRSKPRVGYRAYFRQGFKEVRVEDLCPITAIEAFDVRVLIGLARLDVMDGDSPFGAPMTKAGARSSGPLSSRMAAGRPWREISSSSTRMTRVAGIEVATSTFADVRVRSPRSTVPAD